MKKTITLLLIIIMAFSLCACGSETVFESENLSETQGMSFDGGGNLELLCKRDGFGCSSKAGYYYLTEDCDRLQNGDFASHMMYMDFKTQQEIYLCSDTGCNHNTADCSSVFLNDDFPSATTLIFIYNDKLYILSKDMDRSGEVSTEFSFENKSLDEKTESIPTILYRANLDGTDREKIYAFDSLVTLEDLVLGNENGIYVITKKLSAERHGASTYNTSSEKNLVFLDVEKREEKLMCSLDFNDSINWNVQGCFDQSLVLTGNDFGKELSFEEKQDEDTYKALYDKSDLVFATLNLKENKPKEVFRIKNKVLPSYQIRENMLYCSTSDEDVIKSIDLTTGKEKQICTLKQNYISHIIGDYLCCQEPDTTKDSTLYFVDINTGEVKHSKLVNKSLGWSLEFRAVLESEVLVIYDYDAEAAGDGSYEIKRYQYGLISQKDLVNGRDNYREIKMIGVGK